MTGLQRGVQYDADLVYRAQCNPEHLQGIGQAHFIVGVGVRLTANADKALTGQDIGFAAAATGSNPPYSYRWDLDDNGTFETAAGASVQRSFATAGARRVTVQVRQSDGDTATATATVQLYAAPPTPDTGVSINNGDPYTGDKEVTLALSWPAYATAARVSDDGGFAHARTVPLATAVQWTLDDRVQGRATKVVYVRFTGDGIDETRTFSDDIILDTQAPTVAKATATRTGAANPAAWAGGTLAAPTKPGKRFRYRVKVKATDRLTGVRLLQIKARKHAATSIRYRAKISIRLPKVKALYTRVSDGAGNWTKWKRIRVRSPR